MQKKFTIAGVGICYGKALDCETLIENVVTDTPIEGDAPADAFAAAIAEALQTCDAKEVSVRSNVAVPSELRERFAFQEVQVCASFGEMLETADARTLLLAGDEKGYVAVLLTQDDTGFAAVSVDGKYEKKADAAETLFTVLLVALEIRYALCLRETSSSMYRFWDSMEKRQATVTCGSLTLHFTEPEVLYSRVYETKKYIFPIVFTTVEEAKTKLQTLKESAVHGMYAAMQACFAGLAERTTETNTIVFVAEDQTMLEEDIDRILAKSKKLLRPGFRWRTRNGSLYICRTCADPKVIFTNPPGGMFLAKSFYKFFYKLYGAMAEASRFETAQQYTGSGENFLSRAMFDLVVNYTVRTLLDSIGITPDVFSGLCQGELSILFERMQCKDEEITDMWSRIESGLKKTIATAMRGDNQPLEDYLGRKIERFAKYYLKHDLSEVRAAVDKYDSVFMWEVGSIKDVMIEGDAADCQKIIEELGCMATELADPLYIHTPIMEDCREEIRSFILDGGIHIDTEKMSAKIFSTYYMKYLNSESEMLADNLSHLIVDEADYSGVPEALYADGARIFIDLSPIQLCNTWTRTALHEHKDAQILSIYGTEASAVDLCDICAAMLAGNVRFAHEKLLSKLSFADDTVTSEMETVTAEEIKEETKKTSAEQVSAEQADSEKTDVQKVSAEQAPAKTEVPTAEITKVSAAAETAAVSVQLAADNTAELQQYIRRQMAMNEEAFRLYMNAQNALYEQLLGAQPTIQSTVEKRTATEKETVTEIAKETITKTVIDTAKETEKEIKKDTKTETTTETAIKTATKTETPTPIKLDAAQKPCIWNREEIITMTDSSMAAVLGEAYEVVDKYPVRARMPLPPFLFVSRITEIDAEFGVLRPGRIVAEYDFDETCVFRVGDTRISSCVAAEASHIGIFLMGYMGLDAMSDGKLSFRALDCNQVYVDDTPFSIGDTMRTVFTIHRFAQNGPTTILYYDYETWNGDKLVSRSEAAGGFFTQAELASNKGVISSKVPMKQLEPKTLLHYGTTDQATYTPEQLAAFFRGEPAACFGKDFDMYETYYLHRDYPMQMLERVTKIDYNGGKYGRGFFSGEKTITPDLWPFDVHFKNDPVFPGIIMIDGVTQMEIFIAAQTGALSKFKNAEMRMITDQGIVTKFRGQVRRGSSLLRYELHVKDASMREDGYYLTSDVAIFNDEVQVISIDGFGLKIVGERIGEGEV